MLCLPAMFLCGCKGGKPTLPAINASRYFESTVTTTIYNKTAKQNLEMNNITSSSPNTAYLNQYVQYELTGDGSWIYKMYIESIYFYVYTSNTANEAMTITLTITNMADESDLTKTETITKTCPVVPGKNKSTLCKFDIGKVVATATTTKLTIDILETASATFFEDGIKWMVYDFTVYGESRAYISK